MKETKQPVTDAWTEKLETLAQLRLSGTERAACREALAEMLAYLAKLDEADTAHTEPLVQLYAYEQRLRDDAVKNGDGASDTLQNAPVQAAQGFVVPHTLA